MGKTHCVFYIHGYNKPFLETLEQGWLLQEKYGVEVVLFSWPSDRWTYRNSAEWRDVPVCHQLDYRSLDIAS